jgi:hypothetical protein
MVLALVCAASSSASPQEKPVPNELPRSWSLEEIAKETPPFDTDGRVYVLAWKVVQDDRPLRVESCLALRVLDKNQGYYLAHLYRHPASEKPAWQIGMTHVSGAEGTKYFPGLDIMHVKRFKSRPTNKELYAALVFKEVNWSFELEKGWKLVSCGVCEKSWQDAIGEKPSRLFGCAGQEKNLLQATLSLVGKDEVQAVFHNGTNEPMKIGRQELESSILALEVRDSSGKVIAPMSPPVPSAKPEFITLAPGQKHPVTYQLDGFNPPLATGKYRVRVRLQEWQSNELVYPVGKENKPQTRRLTPEEARSALLAYLRAHPESFEVRLDADEYARKRMEIQRDGKEGKYRFGWFHVDVPGKVFALYLVPTKDSFAACRITYQGTFLFTDGRWVAQRPKVICAKVR